MERHIGAKLKRQLEEVGRPRPATGELRLRSKLLVVRDERVVDQVIERDIAWDKHVGCAGDDEVVRLTDAQRASRSRCPRLRHRKWRVGRVCPARLCRKQEGRRRQRRRSLQEQSTRDDALYHVVSPSDSSSCPRSAAENPEMSLATTCRAPRAICQTKFGRLRPSCKPTCRPNF